METTQVDLPGFADDIPAFADDVAEQIASLYVADEGPKWSEAGAVPVTVHVEKLAGHVFAGLAIGFLSFESLVYGAISPLSRVKHLHMLQTTFVYEDGVYTGDVIVTGVDDTWSI